MNKPISAKDVQPPPRVTTGPLAGSRKVYSTPPPRGAGGGFGVRRKSNQPAREVVALDGLSLDVQGGEIFGLLGPNGAGKSTTVGILTTRVRPTNGQAWIGDYDVWAQQV